MPGSEVSGGSDPPTSDTVASDPGSSVPSVGPTDCGTFDLAGGWPKTKPMPSSFGRCISAAFVAGRSALLVVSEQTDGHGGSPVVTTYLVVGPRRVLVRVDASRAVGRPQVVALWSCERLDGSVAPPKTSRCVPGG